MKLETETEIMKKSHLTISFLV